MYEFLSFTKKSFSLIYIVLYAVKVKDISILKMIINIFVYIERLYSWMLYWRNYKIMLTDQCFDLQLILVLVFIHVQYFFLVITCMKTLNMACKDRALWLSHEQKQNTTLVNQSSETKLKWYYINGFNTKVKTKPIAQVEKFISYCWTVQIL